eukprot:CAMPEP_0206333306 /NCGR_PEP_ID=MMETSP0106_2-20121207/25210_1 /ASSEMBLY_ACC=CAM_ASM_000206 /TAXON_ID=81532 /ORGANISM="Acanthoeca-like sp., Strain 10tr" /LENGTH=33 /DNA_ID= /DNA_START= /DNA_END= /DNA_ORIENTATION=
MVSMVRPHRDHRVVSIPVLFKRVEYATDRGIKE